MTAHSLQDIYAQKLQDLYSAEQQIVEALPQMIAKARNAELKRGFETHLRQTQEQIRRLEQLFQQQGARGGSETCKAMKGIIDENQHVMKQVEDGDALDAALIAGAQAVEHYEMAGYGTARTWARQLGREQDARLLQQTLTEEEETDRLLTEIAESMVNPQAAHGDRAVARPAQSDMGAATGTAASGSAASRGNPADTRRM